MSTPSLTIRVTRDLLGENWTLGTVELDLPGDGAGFLPFGYSVEDTDRRLEEKAAKKIKKRTAIPLGTYGVRLYDSPKHGPDTPELEKVPGFQHVQIHSGNTAEDTEGCLLFGLARDPAVGKVVRSRPACNWIRAQVIEVIKAGGQVNVQIRRRS